MSELASRPLAFALLIGVAAAAGCSSSGSGGSAGVDASGVPEPEGAIAPVPRAPTAPAVIPASLRAVHIAARQAEGASDPRFQVVADGRGFRTERQHGLEAHFDPRGVTLRTAAGLEGRLEVGAVRCDARALPAPRGELAVDPAKANRVARGGAAATEWYVHGPLGLEHGFDLDPAGCTTTLAIELATPGFTPTLVGDHVRLAAADGAHALRYGDLYAHDADDVALPARFVVDGGRVTISVDVARAHGKVAIDPLIYDELSRVGPISVGDGEASDEFGVAVALSGNTMVVGARSDDVQLSNQGSVYVYDLVAGNWNLTEKLLSPSPAVDESFGHAVALDGDYLVVGAYGAGGGAGNAYFYYRTSGSFSLVSELKDLPSDAPRVPGDQFGISVALQGTTMLVGAPGVDGKGAVYAFPLDGSLLANQKLVASDRADGDDFGVSVAVDGDNLLVGADGDDLNAALGNAGSVYPFRKSGALWIARPKLISNHFSADAHFGQAVALSGTTAVVGAYLDDSPSAADAGAAYVFEQVNGTWQTPPTQLLADGGSLGDQFGVRVAISGDRILVGAWLDDVGFHDVGAVYPYVRAANGGWTEQSALANGLPDDHFGVGLAIENDRAAVGALAADLGNNQDQGRVAVYLQAHGTWGNVVHINAGDGSMNDNFGASVAMTATTAVIGSPHDDGVGVDSGSAVVYVRSGASWSRQATLTALDAAAGDNFGASVAISGDTVVLGAPFAEDGTVNDAGAAYVFVRSGTTWSQQGSSLQIGAGARTNDHFGASVAISGERVVVGAGDKDIVAFNVLIPDRGSAFVYTRSGTTWTGPAALGPPVPGTATEAFGASVAIDGDTVLVGASAKPAAYVFVLSAGQWQQQEMLQTSPVQVGDKFGASVALAGNRAVVGAPQHQQTIAGQGVAYTFLRTGTDWAPDGTLIANDAAQNDRFGSTVSLAGTMALIGASLDDAPLADQGSAYAFLRRTDRGIL